MFKIGDKVIVLNELDFQCPKGTIGSITRYHESDGDYTVTTQGVIQGWFRDNEIVLYTKITKILYGVNNG